MVPVTGAGRHSSAVCVVSSRSGRGPGSRRFTFSAEIIEISGVTHSLVDHRVWQFRLPEDRYGPSSLFGFEARRVGLGPGQQALRCTIDHRKLRTRQREPNIRRLIYIFLGKIDGRQSCSQMVHPLEEAGQGWKPSWVTTIRGSRRPYLASGQVAGLGLGYDPRAPWTPDWGRSRLVGEPGTGGFP